MFCPRCGAQTPGNGAYCGECGAGVATAEVSDARTPLRRATEAEARYPGGVPSAPVAGATYVVPAYAPVVVVQAAPSPHPLRTLAIAGGLLLLSPALLVLVPLGLALLAALALAGLVAGVALVGLAIKLAPVVLLGLVGYWLVTQRRHAVQPRQ